MSISTDTDRRCRYAAVRDCSLPVTSSGEDYPESASPNVQTAAPSRTRSFSRNTPGAPERAGNPRLACQIPGVVKKNESVTRDCSTAMALPRADLADGTVAFGSDHLAAKARHASSRPVMRSTGMAGQTHHHLIRSLNVRLMAADDDRSRDRVLPSIVPDGC